MLPLHRLPFAFADDHSNDCTNPPPTTTSFLDVSIAGGGAGRIVISLSPYAPLGVARFSSLVSGTDDLIFRHEAFVQLNLSFFPNIGIRSFGVDVKLARRAGGALTTKALVAKWATVVETKCGGMKRGAVGICVRDPARPPPMLGPGARSGMLVVDEEEVGVGPYGTDFVIAVRDSSKLDSSTLVVGRVVDGMDVVERLAEVETMRENSGTPSFRVAELIGVSCDTVTERGFHRPSSVCQGMAEGEHLGGCLGAVSIGGFAHRTFGFHRWDQKPN